MPGPVPFRLGMGLGQGIGYRSLEAITSEVSGGHVFARNRCGRY